MTYDAVYAKNPKGNWVFKAMNDRALKIMGEFVGGPWQMAKEVFWECGEPRFEEYVQQLCRLGLTSGPAVAFVEKPKPVKTMTDEQLRLLTDF
jgi:hypothetical protein